MKTAIVYYSRHHENTKKLLTAIAGLGDVTLINVSEPPEADLSGYDRIGFASGIYYSKFHKLVLSFAQKNLPEGKKVFFVYTYGAKREGYTKAIRAVAEQKKCTVLGEYGCQGFNTFGPFGLIGGMGKGRPNAEDVQGAVAFYRDL